MSGMPAVYRRRPRAARALAKVLGVVSLLAAPVSAQVNIDGGRSDLPGMKQDMFDQAQKNRKAGGAHRMNRGPPDCPKSDKMSPFWGLALVSGELFVRVNASEGKCSKLLTVGGANYSVLTNASRTCGPAGEVKKRIAEELSAVFFQAGLDWVKHENETIEVVTEDGTFAAEVSEAKWAIQSECWARGCECEQAKNPIGKAILWTCLAIGIGGLLADSAKLSLEKIKGKKPSKHVECKKGHKMEEVRFCRSHICDICGKQGTNYQCSVSCPYDLCKECYKAQKKKARDDLQAWYEKHPEDKAKDEDKKEKKKKKAASEAEDSDGAVSGKEGRAESEAGDSTKAESETGKESKADSSKPDEETDKEKETETSEDKQDSK